MDSLTTYADFARALVSSREAPARLIRSAWAVLGTSRAGRRAFAAMIARAIPYTGTIGAEFEQIDRGSVRVRIRDRPELRNHLGSIHAAALFNLIEVTANIGASSRMPDDCRFIVASMSIDYVKKARGEIVATCDVPPIETNERRELPIEVTLTDETGEVVTRGRVVTLLGPVRG